MYANDLMDMYHPYKLGRKAPKIEGGLAPPLPVNKKMSVSPLTITLHRNGKGPDSDDVIRITPFMDEFKIEFVGRVDKVKHFHYATQEQTVQYVGDLLYLLPNDSDPYEFMQFDFPCFPSVMFKVGDLDDKTVRRTVRDRLTSTLENWPEKMRYGSRPVDEEMSATW